MVLRVTTIIKVRKTREIYVNIDVDETKPFVHNCSFLTTCHLVL